MSYGPSTIHYGFLCGLARTSPLRRFTPLSHCTRLPVSLGRAWVVPRHGWPLIDGRKGPGVFYVVRFSCHRRCGSFRAGMHVALARDDHGCGAFESNNACAHVGTGTDEDVTESLRILVALGHSVFSIPLFRPVTIPRHVLADSHRPALEAGTGANGFLTATRRILRLTFQLIRNPHA
jgi:hypothetical protein